MRYFPNNKTSSFITELPQSLHLHGDWEVALSEIQFPNTFFHVRRGENILRFVDIGPQAKEKNKKDEVLTSKEAIIPNGVYNNMEELATVINSACKEVGSHFRVELEKFTGGSIYFSLACPAGCNLIHYMHFSDRLLQMLGIGDFLYNAAKGKSPYCSMLTTSKPNSKEKSTSIFVKLGSLDEDGVRRAGFYTYEACSLARGIPDKLFVYCDICEPYITGDVQTPLLRIVPVTGHGRDYEYGTNQVKHFSPPHYIPLRQTNFRRIEIDIKDDTGKKIPFESGTLTVTLHFKRVD